MAAPAAHINRYTKFTLPTMAFNQPFESRPADKPKRSGALFIALNVLRFLGLVTLVLVIASQFVALVSDVKAVKADKAGLNNDPNDPNDPADVYDCDYFQYSAVPTQAGGIFWSVLNRVFIVLSCLVLLVSELSLPIRFLKRAYETYIPVLSDLHGLGFLGIAMIMLAVNILSRFVQSFEQISAWMLVIFGGLNGVVGLLLRVSAKERRLIFSWGNLAQLTPQTQVAHAVFTEVSDKFHAFQGSEPGGHSTAPSEVQLPMYQRRESDDPPRGTRTLGESGNTTLVNNSPDIQQGGAKIFKSPKVSWKPEIDEDEPAPVKQLAGPRGGRVYNESSESTRVNTPSTRQGELPASEDAHSEHGRYEIVDHYVEPSPSVAPRHLAATPPPPPARPASRAERGAPGLGVDADRRSTEGHRYEPGSQHGGFGFGRMGEQRAAGTGHRVVRPQRSASSHSGSQY